MVLALHQSDRRVQNGPIKCPPHVQQPVPGRNGLSPFEQAVLEQLAAIRALLEQQDQPKKNSGRSDAILLLAVAEAVADRAFSAAEVIAHARLVDGALRAALEAAGVTNGRKLGKVFRRLEGHEIAGLRLVRLGAERDGIVWRVSRV